MKIWKISSSQVQFHETVAYFTCIVIIQKQNEQMFILQLSKFK